MLELRDRINSKLEKRTIAASVLLSRFKVIEERSRYVQAYNDPTYAPFFYYLGCELKPISMVEIGLKLGLLSGSFLLGCHTVERYLGFQQETENSFYSPRLARSNISSVYKKTLDIHVGAITDKEFSDKFNGDLWDLVIINEETTYDRHLSYLEFVWTKLNDGGLIVMDYTNYHKSAGEAFSDFCKIRNRDAIHFSSKYGAGLIEK